MLTPTQEEREREDASRRSFEKATQEAEAEARTTQASDATKCRMYSLVLISVSRSRAQASPPGFEVYEVDLTSPADATGKGASDISVAAEVRAVGASLAPSYDTSTGTKFYDAVEELTPMQRAAAEEKAAAGSEQPGGLASAVIGIVASAAERATAALGLTEGRE